MICQFHFPLAVRQLEQMLCNVQVVLHLVQQDEAATEINIIYAIKLPSIRILINYIQITPETSKATFANLPE